MAAPFITHVCALIEHRIRTLNGGQPTSANLIRALSANGAMQPERAVNWLGHGLSDAQANRRILRAIGYGKPDPYRCCYSDNNRAVLFAEDETQERHFHLYKFDLPDEFIETRGTRCIRVSLAFDPPVRGTRLEYMSRCLTMQVFRGVSTDRIRQAIAKLQDDETELDLPDRAKRIQPQIFEWSTLQSAEIRSDRKPSFQNSEDDEASRGTWHVLIGCKHRFQTDETENRQRYCLVLSIEHSDEQVHLYQNFRNQVQSQVEERERIQSRIFGS